MASLGTLTLDLVARTAGFTQGMSKAERSSAKWRRQVKKDVEQIARASGVAFAAIGGSLTALVVKTTQAADEIQRFATISQATTTEFQRFAAGAEKVGISNEKLADIFKDVNDRVGDFLVSGGGPLVDFFETVAPKIGVTAEELKGLSGPQALQFLVSSLEEAGASSQEFTFFLESIASDATALLPLLKNNGDLVRAFGDEAEAAGAILDAQLIQKSIELNAQLDASRRQFKGLALDVAEDTIPVLNDLAGVFFNNRDALNDVSESGSIVPLVLKRISQAALVGAGAFEVLGKGLGTSAAAFAALGRQEGEGFFSTAPLKRAAGVLSEANADLNNVLDRYSALLGDIEDAGSAPPLSGVVQGARSADVALRQVQESLRQVTGPGVGLNTGTGGNSAEEKAAEEREKAFIANQERIIELRKEYGRRELEQIAENLEWENQITAASRSQQVDIYAQSLGQISNSVRQFAGEQSGIYEAVFAVEKAAAIARSIIAIQTGIAQAAAAGPFPANLAAMASVASATAGLISTISSTSIQGQAHDGLMSVPRTGTYILERGERVTTAETSAKMDGLIDEARSGGGSTVVAALGDAEIEKWLGGKSGEKIVLAHIRRNQSTVRSLARV